MNEIEWTVFVVGRVLVGFFFLMMGMSHFGNLAEMTASVAEVGLPAPMVAVIVAGILLVIAGVSFILGYHPPIGVVAAVLFLVPVNFVMHDFWTIDDPVARQNELMTFLRNTAIMGSVLVFLAVPRPWKTSLEEYLQSREESESTDQTTTDYTMSSE